MSAVMKKTAIDLFCGSGAVTLGLKTAGFNVLGALDIDPVACKTYRANHPEVFLIEKDITQVNKSCFNVPCNQAIDLLAVCAPCQPFSTQNKNRTRKDDRIKLVLHSLKFIEQLKPRMVFFENVPGLGKKPIFRQLTSDLKALGYNLNEPRRVDAADLGVPQRRRRMILVGALSKEHLEYTKEISARKRSSVRNAIENLPVPLIGSKNVSDDVLHYARAHTQLNIERLKHIPHDGGSRDALPEHLQLACHKKCDSSSYTDTYGRLAWESVAPTLTTGCTDITRGRYAHPVQNRAITLREAARLQSFPDHYLFKGNSGQIATQIGNAVPPVMMENIALVLSQALSITQASVT